MLFAFLIAILWAHPFDVNFYGHDLECRLEERHINIQYTLEIPNAILSNEMKTFWAENQTDLTKEDFKEAFIQTQYETLATELDLLINDEFVPWMKTTQKEVVATEQGQFASFELHLSASIPPEAKTIAIINSNVMGERSIFRNRCFVDESVLLHDTDMVLWKNDKIHSSLHGKWDVTETQREIRMTFSVRPEWSTMMYQLWHQWFGTESNEQSIEDALRESRDPWIENWKRGTTSLDTFVAVLCSAILLCFIRIESSSFETILGSVVLVFIGLLGDIPWTILGGVSVVGMLLLLGVSLIRVISGWPIYLFVLGSFWLKPTYLGIPLLLMLGVTSRKGWCVSKKSYIVLLSFVCLYFGRIVLLLV